MSKFQPASSWRPQRASKVGAGGLGCSGKPDRDTWAGVRTLQIRGRVTETMAYRTQTKEGGRHSAPDFGGGDVANEGLTETSGVSGTWTALDRRSKTPPSQIIS